MGLCYWKRSLLQACLLSFFAVEKTTAALAFTNPSLAGLTAGVPYNLTWSGAAGSTTLTLQNGTENTFNDVEIIATGIQQSFIVFTPSLSVTSDDYVLQLKDDSSEETIHSSFFQISPPVKAEGIVTAVDPNLPAVETPKPHHIVERPAPSHPNISTTAKIGVAVGSVTLTLMVIGIVVFYRRRHRDPMDYDDRRSMSGSSQQFLNDGGKTPSEMGMYEPRRPPPAELERGRRERRSGDRGGERWR
ncbi:hypothetical protein VTL71DRAFT_408 [Oculimacula yallundae]|uniref:Yeast cell wall synthesis Kre9/Knh1-like N-terminal domain-containing protein n=1 Tax=Oculimacula yallundae TaxID=86028 RepID=A0ABR4D044_9HELO